MRPATTAAAAAARGHPPRTRLRPLIALAPFPPRPTQTGPNSGLGHNSMIAIIEAQARYIAEAIATARARGYKTVRVKEDVCTRYNVNLQKELLKNVWANCHSWYNLQGAKNVRQKRKGWDACGDGGSTC